MKYSIGIDYGTLSCRGVLINIKNGEEICSYVYEYPHKVMDECLPSGKPLPVDFALQHPLDYLEGLELCIKNVVELSGVNSEDIIGLGVDFTACTVLPVLSDGTPLCFLDEYKDNIHSYVKLWKHHAAQDKANLINEIAHKNNEKFIKRYGGKISSEWLFPKLWQILDEDEDVYNKMDYFIEATDWIIWQLTNIHTRNSCTAGYKAMWHNEDSYPSNEYFIALDKRLDHVVEKKLNKEITPLGQKAGYITEEWAKKTGLSTKTAVAVGNVDAHVCVPALKITGSKKMLAIMGTSTCHMLMSDKEISVDGICGVVKDGILPGLYGYEAGQSCVGDHFAWFVENLVPYEYKEEAKKLNINIYQYLRTKAEKLKVGESGLIALDWWNGNRSILVDADLTGLIIGLTLKTKPEEIYRALIEATAFGTKTIIENFKQNGIEVEEFYASGGIAIKDPMTMQIYADIINMPIFIGGSTQGPALGSAIFGAVAAGSENGGYDNIKEAANNCGKLLDIVYKPNLENNKIYEELYNEYKILHDYFGKGVNPVMKRLKNIKENLK